MSSYSIVFFFILFASSFGQIDIAKYFKICNRTVQDVNECLVEAIQEGIIAMSGGIKELGAPPVDPYHQEEIRVEYKNNQIMATMTMKDIYVEGLKLAKVHNARLRADEDYFHLEVDITTPRVFVRGKYIGEGRYNSLRINAKGEFNTTMTDLVYTWKIDGIPEKKNNTTYMRIKSFYMRPDLGNLKAYISNDNIDSKSIIDFANNFANQNWRPLYREMLPYAQENWNKIGIRIANKIFLKVPYDQLFPEEM
uniref:Odorant binding protein n=1 Tax=Eogystia hippophaecolus TaxID=1206364 RepID=A0A1B3P5H8_EOGHI|nr:odorant binding protein [Eogystia hippophaecolus]